MRNSLSSDSPTICGGRFMLPATPMLVLGSRKYTGSSFAWQSGKCSSDTLPQRRRAESLSSSAARVSSGGPADAATASASRNSRSDRDISGSLVDRRGRIEQERDQVLDLLLGQDAVVAEARHLRACGAGLRVVDLPEDVALHL